MNYRQISCVFLCALALLRFAAASNLPPREKIEKDGWTIEFSPIDRAEAEKLADQTAKFEQIRSETEVAAKIELAPAVIEARAGEFAKKLAELCAMPDRAGDFQNEIKRMLPTLSELLAELEKVVSPRTLSIVRKAELVQRLKAGEKIPFYSYDAATDLVNFRFESEYSTDKDYQITKRPAALESLPLRRRTDGHPDDDPVEALMNEFQQLTRITLSMANQMYGKMGVAICFNTVISNVLTPEFPEGVPNRWIHSGATQWALRRLLVHALNPELTESYLWYHEQQLQKALKNTQRIDLEDGAKDLSADQQAAAYAVFRTIAERHGNEAVTKLLAAFWKLKPARRTSEAFDRICRKQLKQPLAAFFPRGVVLGRKVDSNEK